MQILKITKPYAVQYNNPIILEVGDLVQLGWEETEEKWKGWIWVISQNNEGWIPKFILEILSDGKSGKVKEYYTAKEVEVKAGENIMILKSLNGWSWIKKAETGDEGWIPDENIENSII